MGQNKSKERVTEIVKVKRVTHYGKWLVFDVLNNQKRPTTIKLRRSGDWLDKSNKMSQPKQVKVTYDRITRFYSHYSETENILSEVN